MEQYETLIIESALSPKDTERRLDDLGEQGWWLAAAVLDGGRDRFYLQRVKR